MVSRMVRIIIMDRGDLSISELKLPFSSVVFDGRCCKFVLKPAQMYSLAVCLYWDCTSDLTIEFGNSEIWFHVQKMKINWWSGSVPPRDSRGETISLSFLHYTLFLLTLLSFCSGPFNQLQVSSTTFSSHLSLRLCLL